MDWGAVGVLAGVVTLEGFRRLPPGALVLRRPVFGPWHVAQSSMERGRWALVAWWPPLFTTVVLPPSDRREPACDVAALLARARPWRLALDVLGALVLVALVAALPLAMARLGSGGFLGGMGLAFALAAAASGVSTRARASLGLARRPALAALSPFAAPHAGERLFADLLAQAPRLVVARALLPAALFREWLRPRVYDATAGTALDADLVDVLTPELRSEVLAPPARTPGADRYCPRCGRSYREGSWCGDCHDVALVAFTP